MSQSILDATSLTGFIQVDDPGAVGANLFWINQVSGAMKLRDAGNAAWEDLGGGGGSLGATLTALAATAWAANAIPIGSGAGTLSQVAFAANTFPARSSSGNLVAKAISDFGLSLVDDADAATARTTIGLGNVDNTSDVAKPVSTATQAAINLAVVGLWDFKGVIDCSGNPNYPAALKGDTYVVSVAGKIGGASGIVVSVGDIALTLADNAGGTQAAVGASWAILEANIPNITTVGNSFLTLTNPSAITFPRMNADNTVSSLDAATFLTAIGGAGLVSPSFTTPALGVASATSLALSGTAGAGFITYIPQSAPAAAPGSGFRTFADATGRFSWIRQSDGFVRTWDATLTADRVFTLPDATTTVVGTDATQTLTNKTLTNSKIVTGWLDTNGLPLIAVTPTASAVYGLTLANAALLGTVAIGVTAPTQALASVAGTSISITAQAAVAGSGTAGAAAGGDLTILSGAAARLTSGNARGGHIIASLGAGIGTGNVGKFRISNATGTVGMGVVSADHLQFYTNADSSTAAIVANTLYIGSDNSLDQFTAGALTLASGSVLRFHSGSVSDVILSRSAAATLQMGAADINGSAVAQILRVQSAITGTDQAAANFTIQGSRQTGAGTTGQIIFQTSPKLATGTTQGTYVTALTLTAPAVNMNPSVVIGNQALATTATDGFLYIAGGAGAPTGVPTAFTGRYALYYDSTTKILWINDAGWLQPKTPAGAAVVTWQ